jgi:hypothetical protein
MILENEFGIQIADDIDNYTIIDKNYERKLKLLNIKNNF